MREKPRRGIPRIGGASIGTSHASAGAGCRFSDVFGVSTGFKSCSSAGTEVGYALSPHRIPVPVSLPVLRMPVPVVSCWLCSSCPSGANSGEIQPAIQVPMPVPILNCLCRSQLDLTGNSGASVQSLVPLPLLVPIRHHRSFRSLCCCRFAKIPVPIGTNAVFLHHFG